MVVFDKLLRQGIRLKLNNVSFFGLGVSNRSENWISRSSLSAGARKA